MYTEQKKANTFEFLESTLSKSKKGVCEYSNKCGGGGEIYHKDEKRIPKHSWICEILDSVEIIVEKKKTKQHYSSVLTLTEWHLLG